MATVNPDYAVNSIVVNDKVQIDLTGDTVTPEKLAVGATAHNATGKSITGTLRPGITPAGTIELPADGTYDVAQYASAIVSAAENVQFRRFRGSITSTVTGEGAEVLLVDDPIIGHVANLDSLLIKLTTDFSGTDAYTLLGCTAVGTYHVLSSNAAQYAHRIGSSDGVFNDTYALEKVSSTNNLRVGQLIARNNQLRWYVNSINYAARPCNYVVDVIWQEE